MSFPESSTANIFLSILNGFSFSQKTGTITLVVPVFCVQKHSSSAME